MHSPNSSSASRASHRAGIAGLAGALALTACLSDGPNRTGGDYLERHGLLLETPLHRIEVKGFPVESVFVGDLDPGRLGDSLILAGRWRGFSSQARMAFDLIDTNFVDSLGDSGSLRLSLGFPLPNRGADELKPMVKDVDSMTFLVESWSYDYRHTDQSRPDSLRALGNHFLVRQDTAALFRADVLRRDTLRVAVETLYEKAGGRDSIQVFALDSLRSRLLEGAGNGSQWIVLLQLTHILEDSADTAAMLRLGGSHGTVFSPMLLFGDSQGTAGHPKTATAKQRVFPLVYDGRLGINSRYHHSGSPTAMLTGKVRGLHLRLDRARLLDSLDEALQRMGSSLARASDGEFDLAYFVPFAQLSVPIAAPSVIEGGFPQDIRLISELDSLLPGNLEDAERRLPKGRDEVLVVLFDRNNSTRAVDSVVARFEDVEGVPGLHRFLLWGKDTTRKDTTYLQDGETREVLRSTSARAERLAFSVEVEDDTLTYRYHMNTNGEEEDIIFRDATTGARLTELASRIPRFLKAEDSTLTLRATRGFQRLMNRARLGQEIQSDFFIQPIRNAAADSASNLMVPYPVLGEIEPEIRSGRLEVDIVLYLYPLKAR